MADGRIRIRTEIDISDAEDQLNNLNDKIQDLRRQIKESDDKHGFLSVESGPLRKELAATIDKAEELKEKMREARTEIDGTSNAGAGGMGAGGFERLSSGVRRLDKGFSSLFSGSLKKATAGIGKFIKAGLGILGVSTAINAVRKAASAYINQSQELQSKMQGIWTTLGNAIGPIIERIIDLIGTAVGYISKFISAIFGLTGKAKKSAAGVAGAAKKANKQLAGFDEMNKLADQSSGGGGGGGGSQAYDWSEKVELPDFAQKMVDKIKEGDFRAAGEELGKKVNEFIEDDKIWNDAANIFNDGVIGALDTASGFLEEVKWVDLGVRIHEWFENVNWTEIWDSFCRLVGDVFGAIGGFLAGLLFGESFSEVDDEADKSFWELAEQCFEGFIEGICEFFENIGTWIKEHIFDPFVEGFKKAFGINSPSKEMKTLGGFISDGVKEGISERIGKIVEKAREIWNSIKSVFSSVGSWFGEKFSNAWAKIKEAFSPFANFFSGLWDRIKNTFSTLGTSIGNAISSAVKNGINGIISLIERTINSAISLINGAISLINLIPGVNVGKLRNVSLPRLAQGAIVNAPGRGVPAIVGEAGREAVLPLERNTEWMDILADKIATRGGSGNLTIPVYLSGNKIAEYVIDINNRRAFARNGG